MLFQLETFEVFFTVQMLEQRNSQSESDVRIRKALLQLICNAPAIKKNKMEKKQWTSDIRTYKFINKNRIVIGILHRYLLMIDQAIAYNSVNAVTRGVSVCLEH